MFFRLSTAQHIVQQISKTAAHQKSIKIWSLPIINRLAENCKVCNDPSIHTEESRPKLDENDEKVLVEVSRSEKAQDCIKTTASTAARGIKMPPKKLMKLAKKVKNLQSTLQIIQANKKINLLTRTDANTNADAGLNISKQKLVNTQTNLLEQNMIETYFKDDIVTDNAIAKSKLNLRNLKPKVSGKTTEEEPKPSKSLNSKKRPLRATVDIEMMKSELKQLEDPPITPEEKLLSANRLGFDFFDVPCETLAKNLLGKILVRNLENGTLLKGKIVETESYLGGEDKASQTYQNKITPRNIPMYMPPGTIYVYLTYGMYHCFNVSSKGTGSVVLIRALSPIEGMEQMGEFRNLKPTANAKSRSLRSFKNHELSNGPSKFCMAFNLNRNHSKYSMCDWRGMWIEEDKERGQNDIKIVECARIGIDSAGPEWANKPLRYYVLGEESVSKRNKKAESEIMKLN